MDSSLAPSDRHGDNDDTFDDRDSKRTKTSHEVTPSASSPRVKIEEGSRSPATSTARSTSVGSPEKHRIDSGSLAKAVAKKKAKSKKAPDSGSRKSGARSPSKDELSQHNGGDNEDDETENENVYCVCKGQEEGTMVGCEVCENWFHPKCVGVDEDKVELLDVYICEACESLTPQRTRYKRFCKREGCERRAAPSSKYCSSRCALQVAQGIANGLDKKTSSEVSRSLAGYPTPSPVVSVQLADGSHPPEVTSSHAALVTTLKAELPKIEKQLELVEKRQKLLSQALEQWESLPQVLVEVPARRKGKSKRREMETVEVRPCGWDSRLAWGDAEIEAWDGSGGDEPLCDCGTRCDRHQGWQKIVATSLDVEEAVINRRKQELTASIDRAERFDEGLDTGRKARTEVHQALTIKQQP